MESGMPNLSLQWFDAIDVDRNGELDAAELQRALGLGNLHFSLKSVAQMIRYICSQRRRSPLSNADLVQACLVPNLTGIINNSMPYVMLIPY